MDTLQIKALKVNTYIGIHAWEQRITQPLLIDLTIPLDLSQVDDDLKNTIDYDALCNKVTHFIESKSFRLIETLANEIASLIKKEYPVNELLVSVCKPFAVKNAGEIRVTINR